MRTKFLTSLILSSAFILAACGPSENVADDQSIAAARANGQLEGLYQQIRQQAGNTERSKSARQRSSVMLAKVGQMLARDTLDDITARINASRIDSATPLNLLNETHKLLPKMAQWNASLAAQATRFVDKETVETKRVIAQLELEITDVPAARLDARLEMIAKLAQYTGRQSEQQQLNAKKVYADAKYQQARDLLANHALGQAWDQIVALRKQVPDDPRLRELESRHATSLFLDDFGRLLEDGQADQAYEQLRHFAGQPGFEDIREQIAGPSALLSNYFVDVGTSSAKRDDMPAAYHNFRQAWDLLELTAAKRNPKENGLAIFLEKIYNLSVKASGQGLTGLEWAYLGIIKEFNPGFAGLDKAIEAPRKIIEDRAVRKVTTVAFKSNPGQEVYGARIAAKVTQYLFESIPFDIRVVERDDLSAVIRERRIDGIGNQQPSTSLVSADFLIQGTLLDAHVERDEKSGKRKQRVITGHKQRRNPAYTEWASRSRSKPPAPVEFFTEEVVEDISIEVVHHYKLAAVSASYRLVDPINARIIHTNTINREAEASDTSQEGISLGDFQLALKLASLPTDIEMLNKLADEVALTIGAELVSRLSGAEKDYVRISEEKAADDDFAAAAEQLANAIVISRNKGVSADALQDQLTHFALMSGL